MKPLLTLIVFMLVLNCTAQDYKYMNGSIDPNNLWGLMDNPRTQTETLGYDFDLEVGVRDRKVGAYMFYGSFQEINYQNYGGGVDYYVTINKTLEGALGGNIGFVMRKGVYGNWGSFLSPALRGVLYIWIDRWFAITLRSQLQHRPDIGKDAIYEGSFGLTTRL